MSPPGPALRATVSRRRGEWLDTTGAWLALWSLDRLVVVSFAGLVVVSFARLFSSSFELKVLAPDLSESHSPYSV